MNNGKYIMDLFDTRLAHENKNSPIKSSQGYWRPSLLGRCFRLQYWNRERHEESNPIGADTLRIYCIGTAIHEEIQKALDPKRVEQEFEFEDFRMHVDYFDDDCVYDFKSVRSFGFRSMTKVDYDIVKSHYNHILQVMVEAMYLKKPYGEVIYIEKDGIKTNYDAGKVFRFKMEDWEERVMKELGILRTYWEEEKVPPVGPRAYNGKDCKYCQYQTKCDEFEKLNKIF